MILNIFKLSVASFSLLLLMGTEALAATSNERDSLRGLQGVLVKRVDFNSQPANLAGKLVVQEIRTEVEGQLSQAGILILDEGGYPESVELPFLQIQGAISQIAKNYYAYSIFVELYQRATLLQNLSRPSVVTWREGALSTGSMLKLQERIKFLVNKFIEDYKEANSRASYAQSVSLSPSQPVYTPRASY